MFLQVSVILLTGGVSASVHAGIHTPGSRHPPEQTPPGADTHHWEQTHPPGSRHPPKVDTSPRADIPWSRHPPLGADTHPRQTPPRADTPQSRQPPEQTPPWSRHPYWEQAHPPSPPQSILGNTVNGTHPTGMQSCS